MSTNEKSDLLNSSIVSSLMTMPVDDDNHEDAMHQINTTLQVASDAYYNDNIELISNYEYDALYDRLVELEKRYGVIANSITQGVGAPVPDTALKKVHHPERMLSLSKTKSRDEIADWLAKGNNGLGCLSYKLDGLTVVLTYDEGVLESAVTRGNGEIGEDVTWQVVNASNAPQKIDYNDRIVVRAEALMTYAEFDRINESLDADAKYRNPRNLASGTLRALDADVIRDRHLDIVAFTLLEAKELNINSYSARLDWLGEHGFETVDHFVVDSDNLFDTMDAMTSKVDGIGYPVDGLVVFYDDVAYGDSLGTTAHSPRNGIAFKWSDETAETKLTDIIWSASRTGRLTPVAVFEPVELEGTTVTRASLHNIDVMRDVLGDTPYIGQKVSVYKANMIIPQIASADKSEAPDDADILGVPKICPICGSDTIIDKSGDTPVVRCGNDDCACRSIGALEHFASRDALNIKGLASETISKLIDANLISNLYSIYTDSFKEAALAGAEAIGKVSFESLVKEIDLSKSASMWRVINGLGIDGVGRSVAQTIANNFTDLRQLSECLLQAAAAQNSFDSIIALPGVGEKTAKSLTDFFNNNNEMLSNLLPQFDCWIVDDERKNNGADDVKDFCNGKTFVITGKLNRFANRDALRERIENDGGKVASSVSKKTYALITNDTESGSSKNKKAKELGVRIMSEDDLIAAAGWELD